MNSFRRKEGVTKMSGDILFSCFVPLKKVYAE